MREPYRYRRRAVVIALAVASAAAAVAAGPGSASAQPAVGQTGSEVLGVVLSLEEDDLILDLGTERGAEDGDTVEIWRPLRLKHPVTGKVFTDRFLIGALTLSQVRPSISVAKPVGSLSRDPQKGDVVVMTAKAPKGAPTPAPFPFRPQPSSGAGEPSTPAPSGSAPSNEDPEVVAMGVMLDGLRGADPVQRIRAYEDYVRTKPKGRFARFLYEEAQTLRRVYELERKKPDEPKREEPVLRSFEPPLRAIAGTPLRLAVELSDQATGAVVHVRPPGRPAYSSFPMAPSGRGYYAATITPENTTGSDLQFFIEATSQTGGTIPVIGTGSEPSRIDLEKAPIPPPPSKREGMVVLLTDYADYNKFKGNDRVWQTEGYFQLRYGDTGVRALRSGFGVYRGKGGTVQELDVEEKDPRGVGLTYGYLETEMGALRSFSIIGRGVVGLGFDGVSGGGQLLFRIGNDKQTNLILGGELLGGVGLRGITQLELNTFPRFPILFRIEVTNQPAGGVASDDERDDEGVSQGSGEVGGRGIAQVGMRIIDPLVVSVRGSFQGRTINHAGPGFGAAVSYQW